MASNIERALGSRQLQGAQRLRGGAQVDYQAARIETPQVNSGLAESLSNFMKTGVGIYDAFEKDQKSRGEERSDEIIRKLTPEQRREAVKNGTLLYQDDPYAMAALRAKTGRNAAFLVDDEVAQKIKNGEFRTREEMEQYRHTRLQDAAKSYAEAAGVNPDDADYQKGFNSDITQRNIALYGQHDNFLSEQSKNTAMLANRVDMNNFMSDPNMLRSPDSGKYLSAYIAAGQKDGSIPSDDQARQLIAQSVQDAMSKEGGATYIENLRNQTVTLNGVSASIENILGKDVLDNAAINAQANEYKLNAKRQEQFSLRIQSAQLQDDPQQGLSMITALEEENNRYQTGEEMTPQRQALIDAKNQLLYRIRQDSEAKAKGLVKQQQADQRQLVIQKAFEARLNGDNVSTSYKDMPTNETTGEFTHSDMVNFAQNTLRQIDQMDIPQEAKDARKMAYLRADGENGAFQAAFGTLITDASREWQNMMIKGKYSDDDAKRLNELRRVYAADPSTINQLYPEQAGLLATIDTMSKSGLTPDIVLNAQMQAKSQTKEMRTEADRQWADMKNNSLEKDQARIPTSLDASARQVYDAWLYTTGNADSAREQVSKWLKDQTVTFKSDGAEGRNIGMIPKSALMVTDDINSWKIGQDIIDQARQRLIQTNPWVTNSQLTVSQVNGSVYLRDSTGTINIRYDRDLVSKMYREQMTRQTEQRYKEAEEKANKRSAGTILKEQSRQRKKAQEDALRERGGIYNDVSLSGIVDVLTGKSQ